jgi:hypothetical protein
MCVVYLFVRAYIATTYTTKTVTFEYGRTERFPFRGFEVVSIFFVEYLRD